KLGHCKFGKACPLDLYIAYDPAAYKDRHVVECALFSATPPTAAWIEVRESYRGKHSALELLNGICEHEHFTECIRPGEVEGEASAKVFERHRQWFESLPRQSHGDAPEQSTS